MRLATSSTVPVLVPYQGTQKTAGAIAKRCLGTTTQVTIVTICNASTFPPRPAHPLIRGILHSMHNRSTTLA
eukprot:scaffold2989_cov184-Amphora_coffeaeformis.AAC.3